MAAYLRPIAVVFSNRELRRLQLAWAGSSLGTCAYLIALAVVAFRSGGAAGVGFIMLVRTVAAAVAAAPLSSVADRYSRRAVMAISDLIRAGLTAAIAILTATGAPIATIYVLATAIAVVSTVFRPAQAALTPALADTPEELTASNAIAGTIESTSIFLGPGIGGLVLAVSGTAGVFVVCMAAFLWSTVLVWSIDEPEQAAEAAAGADEVPTGTLAGFRALVASPPLLAVTVTYAAQAMVAGALIVFAVVLAIDVLHLGNAGVGYLDCAFGVGGILGGVAAVGLAGSRRIAAGFAIGVLGWGVGVALLGVTTSTVVALVLLAGVGAGNTVVDVAAVTLLQRSADDAVLGRVFGVLETVLLSALGLGSILAPLAIHVLGIRAALISTGLVLPVVVVAFSRALLALDRPDPADRRAGGAAPRPPDLPAPRRGHARAARPRARAGRPRLGRRRDPPGRSRRPRLRRRLGRARGRGRRAGRSAPRRGRRLRRDRPPSRRAPNRHGPGGDRREVLTLGRDEFLAAVTGHPASAAEADLVVATRLAALRPGIVKA